MTDSPTILQVVHGYPPREVAGTELYTARLTEVLRSRGWRVHVLAATRDPGRAHGSLAPPETPEEPWRIVNNLPWRPLASLERDPGLEARIAEVLNTLAPDLVHVQHLLFLSAGVAWPAPVLATLHDAWGWCARGGTLLRDGASPCPGPEPTDCARCYSDWARGGVVEHTLGRLAGHVGRWVPPERLQAAWQGVPAGLRGLTRRGPRPTATADQAERRQQAVKAAFRAFDRRVAPSRWLAEEAERQGMGPTVHLPHGVPPGPERTGGGPCLFLGSLVPHKGPHLVVEGWQLLSARRKVPPLVLRGPATDPGYVATLPPELLQGPVAPAEVGALMAQASVLVMGSLWPENAPLVALEARAAGCPVVAPRIGGLPELIEDGVDGALYKPGDAQDLARALDSVLETRPSPRPPPTFASHVDAVEAHYRALLP